MTRNNAVAEVTAKWGKKQTLQGPLIVVPYVENVKQQKDTPWIVEQKTRYATFLPEHLNANVKINSEIRYRSIYGIPLYRSKISLKGDFDIKQMALENTDRKLQWDKARLIIAISDPKSIHSESFLRVNRDSIKLEPGTSNGMHKQSGFHAQLDLDGKSSKNTFEISLDLGGSDGFYIAPVGRHSSISISSDWKDPSFQGNWLPSDRVVNEDGFTASWEIPYLGRDYPQNWFSNAQQHYEKMCDSAIGVDLVFPLDAYGKAERSIKYELIFIGLTFVGFWLFEILSGVRIHPMQYILVGGAICLFYLLLLSLAEHIGFQAAYFISASMVVTLVTVYAKKLLEGSGRAAIVGASMSTLYLYLYALLQEQEYSLLAGSIGLFVILALVMFLTRNVSWYTSKEVYSSTVDM
jgi:inner membrane protein